MAVDVYMVFIPNSGSPATSESMVDFGSGVRTADPFPGATSLTNQNFFEVYDWSLDTEQTFSLGSGSSGAGKITFNPLEVTRRVDLFSETLFLNSATGTTFKYVDLLLRKTSGSTASSTYLGYRFGQCAVRTLNWYADDEAPLEKVSFEYGSLSIAYAQQRNDGTFQAPVIVGWDRIRNVRI